MQAVILIGIQATGKSTFYREKFFDTHIRINLDMLKTRHREALLLRACLEAKQSFVVDNTNPTRAERARYIMAAQEAGFSVVGYFFESRLQAALVRNRTRTGTAQIPEKGIGGTARRLELPSLAEGFDELFFVRIENGGFVVEPWREGKG